MLNVECSHHFNLQRQNLPKPIAQVFQPFRRITAALLRYRPALITDFIQRFHDGRPIVVALKQRDIEARAFAFLVGFLATVFLDVEFLNPLAED